MCVLCVEIQKKSMSLRELARAYREFEAEELHKTDLFKEIEENYGINNLGQELEDLYLEEITGE